MSFPAPYLDGADHQDIAAAQAFSQSTPSVWKADVEGGEASTTGAITGAGGGSTSASASSQEYRAEACKDETPITLRALPLE
jgi:hypothetical protein